MRARRDPVLRSAVVALLAAGACTTPPPPVVDEDTRIDMAGNSNDPDSFGTQMCVTSDGTQAAVYVLFQDDREVPADQDRVDLWLTRSLDFGETWLPAPVKVNHGPESSVYSPHLACNGAQVFVVWEDDRNGTLRNHDVFFNRSDDSGETFLPEDVLLEDDDEGLSMTVRPRLAVEGQQLYVVWSDNAAGAFDVQFTSSIDAGVSWTRPIRLDADLPGAAYSGRAEVAVAPGGTDVYAVWEDARDEGGDLYSVTSDDAGLSFHPEVRVDSGDPDGTTDAREPQVCVSNSGYSYVVWQDDRNGDGDDIFVTHTTDGGEHWAAPVRLDMDAAGFGQSESPVCLAEEARVHVVWRDKRAENLGFDVYYREVNAGIAVTDEVRLDVGVPEAGFSDSMTPVIAGDAGAVMVGWAEARGEALAASDNGTEELLYNFSRPGEPFSAEADFRIDGTPDLLSSKTDLAIAVLGNLWLAAWTDDRNGTSDIYFRSLELGQQPEIPVVE